MFNFIHKHSASKINLLYASSLDIFQAKKAKKKVTFQALLYVKPREHVRPHKCAIKYIYWF